MGVTMGGIAIHAALCKVSCYRGVHSERNGKYRLNGALSSIALGGCKILPEFI